MLSDLQVVVVLQQCVVVQQWVVVLAVVCVVECVVLGCWSVVLVFPCPLSSFYFLAVVVVLCSSCVSSAWVAVACCPGTALRQCCMPAPAPSHPTPHPPTSQHKPQRKWTGNGSH